MRSDPDNYVNVAKVDCDAHREIGSRFDIKGFPTVKMISKGKMYEYKGKKEAGEIIEFARGNFKFEESEDVPADLGLWGEVQKILKHAYKTAINDYNAGNFFTKDIFLISMPFLFIISLLLIIVLPVGPSSPSPRDRKLRTKKKQDLVEPDDDVSDILTSRNST